MTEEEAKTKQCCGPLLLAAAQAALEFRKAGQAVPAQLNPNCIATGCMAWRWILVQHSPDDGQPVEVWPDLMPYHPAGTKLTRHGVCGLAGKP